MGVMRSSGCSLSMTVFLSNCFLCAEQLFVFCHLFLSHFNINLICWYSVVKLRNNQAVLMIFFWVQSPCGLVGISQRFGEAFCLHLQGWRIVTAVNTLNLTESSCSYLSVFAAHHSIHDMRAGQGADVIFKVVSQFHRDVDKSLTSDCERLPAVNTVLVASLCKYEVCVRGFLEVLRAICDKIFRSVLFCDSGKQCSNDFGAIAWE
jgi:hypothetical protein